MFLALLHWGPGLREGCRGVKQLSGAVKGSLGPSVLVPVFFRVGLEEVEENVGQNSLLTSISCLWGAQGSQGGVEGRVALLI